MRQLAASGVLNSNSNDHSLSRPGQCRLHGTYMGIQSNMLKKTSKNHTWTNAKPPRHYISKRKAE